jgi:hypothetical protein
MNVILLHSDHRRVTLKAATRVAEILQLSLYNEVIFIITGAFVGLLIIFMQPYRINVCDKSWHCKLILIIKYIIKISGGCTLLQHVCV